MTHFCHAATRSIESKNASHTNTAAWLTTADVRNGFDAYWPRLPRLIGHFILADEMRAGHHGHIAYLLHAMPPANAIGDRAETAAYSGLTFHATHDKSTGHFSLRHAMLSC